MPLGSNGNEKRYINGKEIVIKPKQPYEIQKKIDSKSEGLQGDVEQLRSTYNPDKLWKENLSDLGDAFGRDTFTSFSKVTGADKERDKQREYQVYRDMYSQIFIKNALDIVKNEAAQKNDEGNLLKVISDNQDIIDDAYELFFDIFDINYELKTIILDTCQMGDNFYEIVLDNYENPTSIVHLHYISQERLTILQENGRIKYYIYTEEDLTYLQGKSNIDPYNVIGMDEKEHKYKVFMPWQIVHFKIKDRSKEPYGRSLLRAGIKDYRRLALLEDAMLVYRISRAPERRIFYVDVGQLNNTDAKIFLNKIKNTFKKEPIIDESGHLSEKANVMSLMEDFYIPVREGSQGTRIEPLAGGVQLNEIKDMNYFKDKILRLLNIPMAYIGGSPEEGQADASRSLSNIDIKFANYIEEIQSFIIKGLNKILALQLILKRYKNEDIVNFKIELTPPSNLAELIKLDYLTQQITVATSLKGTQMFSDETIYKKIFKMSDKEIYREQIKLADQMKKMAAAGIGVAPGSEMGGVAAAPPAGGAVLPPPGESSEAPAPGAEIGGAPAVGVPGPQLASVNYNRLIHQLGLNVFNENMETILVNDLISRFGNEYLIENKEDVMKLICELGVLKNLFEKEEKEETKKKKKIKNNFQSMVRLGEFNGFDTKNKTLTFFRDGEENIIDLSVIEDFEDK